MYKMYINKEIKYKQKEETFTCGGDKRIIKRFRNT